MCLLVNQRKKACPSVQDLEYAENYWKYVQKYSGYQREGETEGTYCIL